MSFLCWLVLEWHFATRTLAPVVYFSFSLSQAPIPKSNGFSPASSIFPYNHRESVQSYMYIRILITFFRVCLLACFYSSFLRSYLLSLHTARRWWRLSVLVVRNHARALTLGSSPSRGEGVRFSSHTFAPVGGKCGKLSPIGETIGGGAREWVSSDSI